MSNISIYWQQYVRDMFYTIYSVYYVVRRMLLDLKNNRHVVQRTALRTWRKVYSFGFRALGKKKIITPTISLSYKEPRRIRAKNI